MRKVTLICVGNVKEKYLTDAVAEYSKRLNKYFDLKIIEVAENKLMGKISQGEMEKALKEESVKILSKIKGSNVCTLCVEGNEMSSEEFASLVEKNTDKGELFFVIGSSYGLHNNVKQNSTKVSFGKMTFPHQLMRVIFLEQLYRAGTIINNVEYHK